MAKFTILTPLSLKVLKSIAFFNGFNLLILCNNHFYTLSTLLICNFTINYKQLPLDDV
jgi:hypothetical protein